MDENDKRIIITPVDNGFIVETADETNVFEEKDNNDEKAEYENMSNLLWEVKEKCGLIHSKHNKYNIIIKIEE